MEYVRLGRAGVKVSRICLGCMSFGNDADWKLDIDKARPIVKRSIDLGINFFDTANAYSNGRSEEIIGELLRDYRQDVVLATKVYFPVSEKPNQRGLSRLHITKQIDSSLKRLGTDHVDLYQIHRWDYETPVEETLRTLDALVHQGKVRYIGASSMWAWQFERALWISDRLGLERFVSMQNHYNLCYREEEREMIPLCHDQGIGLLPWSPLAKGFLSGKYKREEKPNSKRFKSDELLGERFFRPEDFDVVERLEEVAKEKDVSPAQVAVSWLLHKGVTAPIVGPTKLEHVEEAVAAIDVKLSEDDMRRLEEPYRPHRVIGHT
ncbi:MAG TPA: aldo/keto reductase [Candidatus Dormibacteraeota bacterium]|nr:aldo/keto reductase [Candidatus Dormibacteraeota bacterium]